MESASFEMIHFEKCLESPVCVSHRIRENWYFNITSYSSFDSFSASDEGESRFTGRYYTEGKDFTSFFLDNPSLFLNRDLWRHA